MRKIYSLFVALLAGFAIGANGQTLLDEGFELGATPGGRIAVSDGWTVKSSSGSLASDYVWHNYYSDSTTPTITGKSVACCDGPTYESDPKGGLGPREEILLTPELDLNDTYELSFAWRVSPMNANESSRYDLQVRIVEDDNLNGAETVFSIQDQNMLKESGVLDFPIGDWSTRISKVNLSDWKGKKVKIAFVYKMMAKTANVVWLDDVSVKQFKPDTAPVPTLSLDRYNFGNVYIGEKFYTEVITLTNNGLNGLKVTGLDLPDGVATTLDAGSVNLDKYESVRFQLSYTASLTSPASGNAVIHTNGGDVTVALSATKQVVPEGFTLESFEGHFPPAGWTNNGWGGTNTALEGDQTAYATASYSASYLRSPRLDLSHGGQITFTFYNDFTSEEGDSYPENDVILQVSYDGGATWKDKWTADYTNTSVLETQTVDLGTGTDDSYVRWVYTAVEQDDEGSVEFSTFYLDRVLLPTLYGQDGVPTAPTLVSPVDAVTNVYPKDITLTWEPAQFAEGYKLYVGSDAAATNLVNGQVVDGLSYTIATAGYETTYNWKVVAYNSKGDGASSATWTFTTQPDASVVSFPYEENFDKTTDANPVPDGWISTTTSAWPNRAWRPNALFPYKGSGASLATGWMYPGEYSTLTSPEFRLPAAGEEMSISFVWGDEHPRSLLVDETGLLKKENVEGGNGASDVVFEIYADGQWKEAAYLSENFNADGETKYWRNEKVDLSAYAGKTVQFRWINHALSGRHNAASLDNIVINGIVSDKAYFNRESWDAGKVNYERAINSGNIFTVINDGVSPLKVKTATFATENFETTLAPGTEIPVNGGVTFGLQFNALTTSAAVDDELTIEFESGYVAKFPVSGVALPKNEYFQSFENNVLDHPWKQEFTTIDADGLVNYSLNYYETVVENDGTRYAFTSVEHNNDNLKARTGKYTVAAAATDSGTADDWLISPRLKATSQSTFDFYARNLGTSNSVFIGDNDYHSVGIYVSETGTATSDFVAVKSDKQMEYLGENEWHHFEADLSAYAGKDIYIAVHHSEISANWMAFFDDFTFKNFEEAEPTAIKAVTATIGDNADVEVYSVNGTLVARSHGTAALAGMGKGLYILKVKDGNEVKTLRVVRK